MSTAATEMNFGKILNFQDCSGTPETSPFTLVLAGGKCIVCDKRTQTQLAGYWAHPLCARYVAQVIKQAEFEIPLIKQQIVFSSRRCLEASICSMGYDDKKFQAIQKAVTEKAWKIFKQRHPIPWLNRNNVIKETKE